MSDIPETSDPGEQHFRDDVNVGTIVYWGFVSVAGTLLLMMFLHALYGRYFHGQLESKSYQNKGEFEFAQAEITKQEKSLHAAGWVDEAQTRAAVPIDRAIELTLAEYGSPAGGESAPPATDQPTEPAADEEPATEEPAATEEPPATEAAPPAADEEMEEEVADPATEAPRSEEAAADEPTSDEPTTEEPTTEEPATEEPAPEEPGTEEPGTEEPGTGEPATGETTGDEPAAEEPTTDEPAGDEPPAR